MLEPGGEVGEARIAVSAHDVARELRQRLPGAGDVKIHKLLYYCQGWHIAFTGRRMFAETVEAWANGPVVAALWRDERNGDVVSRGSQSTRLSVARLTGAIV